MARARTIALDFDGVLHSYNGFEGEYVTHEPMPGAREAVERLLAHGHTVVVFTTRSADVVEPWLARHRFPPLRVTNRKEPFWVIVDDRAFTFDGDWHAALPAIEAFEPHWIAARRRP